MNESSYNNVGGRRLDADEVKRLYPNATISCQYGASRSETEQFEHFLRNCRARYGCDRTEVPLVDDEP